MLDELELDLNEDNQEEINRKNRFQQLSEKVKITAKERDELAQAKEQEAKARAEAEKERDFFKGFSQVSSKYEGASEYQDKIWEKVKSGYDVEDATVSILNKEGKFKPLVKEESFTAAGGSASIGITDQGEKTYDKMSRAEKLAALKDMEARGEFHF